MTSDEWKKCAQLHRDIEKTLVLLVSTRQTGNNSFHVTPHDSGYGFYVKLTAMDVNNEKEEVIFEKDYPDFNPLTDEEKKFGHTIYRSLLFKTYLIDLNIIVDRLMKKYDFRAVNKFLKQHPNAAGN